MLLLFFHLFLPRVRDVLGRVAVAPDLERADLVVHGELLQVHGTRGVDRQPLGKTHAPVRRNTRKPAGKSGNTNSNLWPKLKSGLCLKYGHDAMLSVRI